MLCNFLRGRGVNNPKLGTNDDVRDGGVRFGITKAHGYKAGAVDDVLDLELCAGFHETLHSGG